MQSFAELRGKLKLARGEKELANHKGELILTKAGREFKLYVQGELADTYKKEKDARKAYQQMQKLFR
tara:strand:- start:321 stop:521 length:201 start_codon:yes stop_codon:yes gene_type:complete